MSGVSIIIPVYNALDYARECLECVYRAGAQVPFEVIVVNNGSAAEVDEWLRSEQQRRKRLTVLSYDRPLGFARAVNEGARSAQFDFLVLLNSDCFVTNGWIDGLIQTLESNGSIGIASPVTDECGPGSQLISGPPRVDVRQALIQEPRRLFFFCAMIRRQLWESLGGLDEAYGVGTYEDDDFCLRTRLAGWSLVVDPNVFVFNHASKTFKENRIDHDEWLFRNEKLFLEKASNLSRALSSAAHAKKTIPSTTVVVAVPDGRADKLIDTLTSLANQTVTGFETLIVSTDERQLPRVSDELANSLRIRYVTVTTNSCVRTGALWNAGMAAAQGEFVAYLPVGDIHFPYHLETLHQSLTADAWDAVYTCWSVAIHSPTNIDRAAVYPGTPERLLRADWAPLFCWMQRRSSLPRDGFREDLASFSEWEFVLRFSQAGNVQFIPALTCERNRLFEENGESAPDAQVVMDAFPVTEQYANEERLEFLRAVETGIWEQSLVVRRAEREYRAKRMLRKRLAPAPERSKVDRTRLRLKVANADQVLSARSAEALDFIFFNILRWNDLFQRPHHFATGLGKRGYRVFWVNVRITPAESFSGTTKLTTLTENVFELQLAGLGGEIYHYAWNEPVVELMTDMIDQLRRLTGMDRVVQFVNFPGWLPLVQRLRQRFDWPILYDCHDDHYAFAELYGQRVAGYEHALTQKCDLLVTSGRVLHETKLTDRNDAVLILNAADYDTFHGAPSQGLLDHLPRPIIGFFGALADWLDVEWVAEAARRFPTWSFVYIGSEGFAREETREQWRAATSAANVHVFPQANLKQLAAYLAQFDVCIMPFHDQPITRSMHAVKIYEYLAAGKHVLVPALPETRQFAEQGLLVTYENREQSFELLQRLVNEPPSPEEILKRTTFAAQNDWSDRLDQLIQAAEYLALTTSSDARLRSEA